jgi:hypothetical protein
LRGHFFEAGEAEGEKAAVYPTSQQLDQNHVTDSGIYYPGGNKVCRIVLGQKSLQFTLTL